ncbi:hypothetical protein [Porphyrobacter sp. YT40]|uniref:hypothetical protein n=1 Tax=Porphyrobacter sp. YT40 TaxID=2547601 RepID=UPI001143C0B3|nr:hypothetical protein [Porphyrobacter sp. YT40]QDH34425.1 hypothetical protein E2E27_08890 [Porphyrobacter sp. YT40]
MSAGGEGLFLGLGIMLAAGGIGAIIRPSALVKESRRNRDARLRELDAGAPERFFEERRELEAYTPRFDLEHRTLRRFGGLAVALGALCIAASVM